VFGQEVEENFVESIGVTHLATSRDWGIGSARTRKLTDCQSGQVREAGTSCPKHGWVIGDSFVARVKAAVQGPFVADAV
jgi:hypothetical protein